MRSILFLTPLAVLASCAPPAPQTTASTRATPVACNDLTPDPTKPVLVQAPPQAVGDTELLGGTIEPGRYDLTGGYVSGGAQPSTATRTAALEIVETGVGLRFNYAETSSNAQQRWTGMFHEGPPTVLDYTCGLSGHVAISFAAPPNQLQLRVPDSSGQGAQTLIFTRRG